LPHICAAGHNSLSQAQACENYAFTVEDVAMRFLIVVFLISLAAFVFFAAWTIQTIWLASFFAKDPATFGGRLDSLLVATGLCFVAMVASIAMYITRRVKLARNRRQ
jgi:hypothetical protein